MATEDRMSPRVSVVVATWNAAPSLQSCLDSIVSQGLADVELIVIDGSSTDGTVSIIETNASSIAYWESKPDRGIYHAWNKALDHAAGQWVYFLGADDVLASDDVLRRVVGRLSDLPEACSIAYGSVRMVGPDGHAEVVGRRWQDAEEAFFEGGMIPHQGAFHRRSLFERAGRFDESYRICGDYELLLRELPNHAPSYLDDIVVAVTAADGVSGRTDMFPVVLRELHRARRKHGFAPEAWRDARHMRSLVHAYLMRWFGRGVADRVGAAYRGITRRS